MGETRIIDLIRQETSDLKAAVATAAGKNSLHSGAEIPVIHGGPMSANKNYHEYRIKGIVRQVLAQDFCIYDGF